MPLDSQYPKNKLRLKDKKKNMPKIEPNFFQTYLKTYFQKDDVNSNEKFP